MAKVRTLQAIRNVLDSHVGQRIRIRANQGRKRVFEKEGVLERTYPSIFVVRFDDGDSRHMSWSYIDVLTDSIEIQFNGDGDQGCG